MSSSRETRITHVRKGRRLYGAIYTLPSGQRCYLAYRKLAQIFRSGETSISAAIRTGKAMWAIDEDTLLQMRAQGVRYVGVLVRDTGEKYVTHLETFFDRAKFKMMNYEARGGALQRYVPLTEFRRSAGVTKKL